MANLQIKIGEKTNRLTLIDYAEKQGRHPMGRFSCECGNEVVTRINRVFRNHCKSCGCLAKESAAKMAYIQGKKNTTHKLTTDPATKRIYNVYSAMLRRCYNSNTREFKWYGGRGIKVCEEWKNDPYAYYQWCINNGYDLKLHIDRIDNNGDYSPENCRVVTSKENMNNTRMNRIITFRGKDMTVSEFADLIGMNTGTLYSRLFRSKYTPEQAYSKPLRKL